jgi:hypothetical protein
MTSYNPNAIFQLLVLAIFGDFLLQSKRNFSASGFSNFWRYYDPNAIFQLLALAIFGDIASWIVGGC